MVIALHCYLQNMSNCPFFFEKNKTKNASVFIGVKNNGQNFSSHVGMGHSHNMTHNSIIALSKNIRVSRYAGSK